MSSTLSISANLASYALEAPISLRRALTLVLYLKVIYSIRNLTTLLLSTLAVSFCGVYGSFMSMIAFRDRALLI